MTSISNKIKIIYDNNYTKIIATENIAKNEIILIEKPIYKENDIIILLYSILKNKEDNIIKNLYPRKNIELLNNNNPFLNISKIINNHPNKKIKQYLSLIDINIVYFYYYKILFNAFDMNNSPTILPFGAMMNHSCDPNIIFYEKNNLMYFQTLKNIKKNEELCYSYFRNYKPNNEKEKKIYLINHYNFECACTKCFSLVYTLKINGQHHNQLN